MSARKIKNPNKVDSNSALLPNNNHQLKAERLRIFLSIVFILIGVYISVSVLSYFITWKSDQSIIIRTDSLFEFIFTNQEPVRNTCGRLGAAISHLLVFKSFGISSLLLGLFFIGLGINVFKQKRIFNLNIWIRYIVLSFLFLCPLLSILTPNYEFSFGGQLGKFLVKTSNGIIGITGTIIMLVIVLFFFLIMIFKLDYKPALRKFNKIFEKSENDEKDIIPNTDNIDRTFQSNDVINETIADHTNSEDDNVFSNNVYIDNLDEVDLNDNNLNVSSSNNVNNEESFNDNLHFNDDIQLIEINDTYENEYDINLTDTNTNDDDIPLSIHSASVDIINENPLDDDTFKLDEVFSEEKKGSDNLEFSDIESFSEVEYTLEEKNGIVVEYPTNNDIPMEVINTVNTINPSDINIISDDVDEYALEDNNSSNSNDNLNIALDDNEMDELDEQVEDEIMVIIPPANESIADTLTVSNFEPYSPELDLRDYLFPTLDLLENKNVEEIALNPDELNQNKDQIINTLRSFGIEIQKIQATVGPTVTLYEIVPQEGVRISKIRNLEDDIALNLAALGIRMIAPIPGRGTIGIEVPNVKKQVVPMRAILSSEKFINNDMSLPIALGKKIDNENYIVDLATMPHLLMAGATGQGKSVGINAILVSLLYKKHPSQLKFVLVDPKKVELSVYRLIEKHYLAKLPNEEESIITDTKKVINTLNSLCIEMDNRYELLKDAGARNIKEYNQKFINRKLNPERGHKYLPFIVLVIDEFADLIMTAGKEVEMPVARLAQLARAVGIHLIVATQRPSVNVITGIIKANFPARIAFRVTSKVDSRTILDTGGADQLIGRGDMLVSHGSELLRIQCAFVDTPEVEKIVEFIGNQRGYPSAFELPEYEGAEDEAHEKKDVDLSKRDKMFEECARLVVHSQSGSTSMLQRKFNLGYNRAGRIMDQLEAAGIVGPQVGSKPREVYLSSDYELNEILDNLTI